MLVGIHIRQRIQFVAPTIETEDGRNRIEDSELATQLRALLLGGPLPDHLASARWAKGDILLIYCAPGPLAPMPVGDEMAGYHLELTQPQPGYRRVGLNYMNEMAKACSSMTVGHFRQIVEE